ncbi:uncharacterized protein BDZ83DRAFT_649264 [Colletotrichum acutatum]|uniref:Uncharacterized protein n=1 Tax=Glomerella acutata TaxID=27357 RepID=A0AAD8USB9_GLOAC|nr:uncharacterized protein BDZ83DRAFT_649264 [Colletotrichum acutatum]KAK1727912.1 hypothetical protein BDZ83DRAFT_649264 [Colletotrichum acutatum]
MYHVGSPMKDCYLCRDFIPHISRQRGPGIESPEFCAINQNFEGYQKRPQVAVGAGRRGSGRRLGVLCVTRWEMGGPFRFLSGSPSKYYGWMYGSVALRIGVSHHKTGLEVCGVVERPGGILEGFLRIVSGGLPVPRRPPLRGQRTRRKSISDEYDDSAAPVTRRWAKKRKEAGEKLETGGREPRKPSSSHRAGSQAVASEDSCRD